MPDALDKRIINLESLLAMQDNLLDTLNEVVTNQQKEIDDLRRDLNNMRESLSGHGTPANENQRPPHY